MAETLTLTCLKPGGGAYVVDGGRPGHRAIGVPTGGPADGRAMAEANRLLGRNPNATCLETTITGGRWLLSGSGQLAITGSDMTWRLNGRVLETYSVLYHEGDGLLTSLPARKGLRSYLAINGHWQLPHALGSAETGLPGIPRVAAGWSVDIRWDVAAGYQTDLDVYQHLPDEAFVLPVIPGPEWNWLNKQQQAKLLSYDFRVGNRSNRQGIRLEHPDFKAMGLPSMISSPVMPGTVQLTPEGPILLGPDAQTVGGYPRVLLVENPKELAVAFQVGIAQHIRLK
ncbi:biotin-dependent carboxyltransferase family protein [Neolewinella aurantiaca]|uniref:Biotin-dependent carboxyltransferase family protein n=1 Tax=Neolewinella aurantiaca TaxID=2602767 RepID=A0A5C7FGU8_9BACT|nr:biotin-dependent carboxyltransferase family protein [Neolewinella aurantiaca]TXF85419.1 biotin-dependent carboxyltransferase family protein [Neolewinella aurantiaca]